MNDYLLSTDLGSWHFANSDSKSKNFWLQWLPIMNHHDIEDKLKKIQTIDVIYTFIKRSVSILA